MSHAALHSLVGIHGPVGAIVTKSLREQVQAQFRRLEQARDRYLVAKRGTDIIAATLALVLLAPMLVAIALALRCAGNDPVIYRQPREGKAGRMFTILKFRSLDRAGRPTHIGSFLRRNSLDELPQLFNVIAGDMSLVGPRPHVPGMMLGDQRYDVVVPYYRLRLLVRPGITGLAQVSGLRGKADDPARAFARIDRDIEYIANLNIMCDLRILARTLRYEFIGGSGE